MPGLAKLIEAPAPGLARIAAAVGLGLCGLVAVGCGADEAPTPEPPAVTAQEATAAPEIPASPVEPVSSRSPLPSGEQRIVAPGLAFSLPADWQRQQPSSSMRLAQAGIPGAAGDGELTVFYFGAGGGGGVDANLERWAAQMETAAGSEPRRESFRSGDLTVTWIDIEGTLLPSTMGTGPTEPQPDSRLLGAVVEGPGGPWFFKATGPQATLADARDDFLEMLRSATATG